MLRDLQFGSIYGSEITNTEGQLHVGLALLIPTLFKAQLYLNLSTAFLKPNQKGI